MSLKPLIKNQTIIIDDHSRNGEMKNWDDDKKDVHIHKNTKTKIEGKKSNLTIKIPINSGRKISISNKNSNNFDKIPRKLKKEIQKAFENKKKREAFIKDLIDVLKNFSSILDNEEKVKEAMRKISKHFDLDRTRQNIREYLDDSLMSFTQFFTDSDKKQYFITINNKHIKISDASFVIWEKNIKEKHK
jgi:molecular chaperone GrpE (heat shock protein)